MLPTTTWEIVSYHPNSYIILLYRELSYPIKQFPNLMDLKQLEYFARVAELGSFTRASIALDIAQPALSRQVRLLEVELCQNLLVRNGRGVATTDAGRALLEHARGILYQLERIHEEMARLRGAPVGRVTLGLPPSLSKVLTVPLTRAFRKCMPDASLSISEGLSVTMQHSLITGGLDVALVYNTAPSPELDSTPLQEEELYLVEHAQGATEVTPIPLCEVAERLLVIPRRPNSIRMLVETELANIGRHPHIAFEIDGIPGILDLVADGAGSAILPRYAVTTSEKVTSFSIRPITAPTLRCRLSLIASSKRPATLTQRAIIDLIRKIVGELLKVG